MSDLKDHTISGQVDPTPSASDPPPRGSSNRKRLTTAVLTLLFLAYLVLGLEWQGLFDYLGRGEFSDQVEVTAELTHVGGNLEPSQRDALLAQAGVHIRANYAPLIAVPGINARWSRCGFLLMPCIDPDSQVREIPASNRVGTRLVFNVPRMSGRAGFRLLVMELIIPTPSTLSAAGQMEQTIWSRSTSGPYVSRAPMLLDGGAYEIGGRLNVRGGTFSAGALASLGCSDVIEMSEGHYRFKPTHRFSKYTDVVLRRADKDGNVVESAGQTQSSVVLRTPVPSELAGLVIHRATRAKTLVDQHVLEAIDIYASKEEHDDCDRSVAYRVLYADDELIAYDRRVDGLMCREGTNSHAVYSQHTHASWLDDGSLARYFDVRYGRHGQVLEEKKFDAFTLDWPAYCIRETDKVVAVNATPSLLASADSIRRAFEWDPREVDEAGTQFGIETRKNPERNEKNRTASDMSR